MSLDLVPVTFAEAKGFVDGYHRHHRAPVGHKFSIGIADAGELVGVAIVGRPVARQLDDGRTLEVIRTATDGTRNANSMLYGACTRASFALGYVRLVTYTEQGETGASLRAAGFKVIAERRPRGGWSTPLRPRRILGTEHVARTLWASAAEVERKRSVQSNH